MTVRGRSGVYLPRLVTLQMETLVTLRISSLADLVVGSTRILSEVAISTC